MITIEGGVVWAEDGNKKKGCVEFDQSSRVEKVGLRERTNKDRCSRNPNQEDDALINPSQSRAPIQPSNPSIGREYA